MNVDPKVVDAELADLYEQMARLHRNLDAHMAALHNYVGDRRTYVSRTRREWGWSDAEVLERARAGTGVAPYDVHRVGDTLTQLEDDRAELNRVRARVAALDSVYRAQPWSRFFLVAQGHIHATMSCSTCNNGINPTEFGWLPQLSGETEAQAVAAHGALLCTVCFPTAPVEWTNHYEVLEAEKAAARCSGSGHGYDPDKPHQLRQNYKWGYCPECGTCQTVTPTGKIRAHKKEA